MSITEREYILQPIHEKAEQAFREHGWSDMSHGTFIHCYTAEHLVWELIQERRRCSELQARLDHLAIHEMRRARGIR